jgi:hypothetical protein
MRTVFEGNVWVCLGSDQGHLLYKSSALPLSYTPEVDEFYQKSCDETKEAEVTRAVIPAKAGIQEPSGSRSPKG